MGFRYLSRMETQRNCDVSRRVSDPIDPDDLSMDVIL